MSLKEFCEDDSLGMWDDEGIDLSSIAVPKMRSLEHSKLAPSVATHNSHTFTPSARTELPAQGPFIVKVSNMPATFGNAEITDIFQSRFLQYIKFKVFWQLSLQPLANAPDALSKYFNTHKKVCFVELHSAADMAKACKWNDLWLARGLGKILIQPAHFEDFEEYNKLNSLLDEKDDAAHNTVVQPARQEKPKARRESNPFGNAKPVDVRAKEAELEAQMEKLAINTTTFHTMGIVDDTPPKKAAEEVSQEPTSFADALRNKKSEKTTSPEPNSKPTKKLTVRRKGTVTVMENGVIVRRDSTHIITPVLEAAVENAQVAESVNESAIEESPEPDTAHPEKSPRKRNRRDRHSRSGKPQEEGVRKNSFGAQRRVSFNTEHITTNKPRAEEASRPRSRRSSRGKSELGENQQRNHRRHSNGETSFSGDAKQANGHRRFSTEGRTSVSQSQVERRSSNATRRPSNVGRRPSETGKKPQVSAIEKPIIIEPAERKPRSRSRRGSRKGSSGVNDMKANEQQAEPQENSSEQSTPETPNHKPSRALNRGRGKNGRGRGDKGKESS